MSINDSMQIVESVIEILKLVNEQIVKNACYKRKKIRTLLILKQSMA